MPKQELIEDPSEGVELLTKTRLKSAREQAEKTVQFVEPDPIDVATPYKRNLEDFASVTNDDVPQDSMAENQAVSTSALAMDPFENDLVIPLHNYGSGVKLFSTYVPYPIAASNNFYDNVRRQW